jgi:hypothetical protein
MFRRESDMTPSVTRWLKGAGLHVKPEFVTPWGICDLAGLSFNSEHVSHRLSLRQRKTVASITRAALLLEVPDVEERRSISMDRLARRFASTIGEEHVTAEVERLIADGFLVRTSRGRLQKLNGWIPLQNRLVAVELKLSRVEEALVQAKANLGFAEESYVAFPMPMARRIAGDPSPWVSYFDDGIGLIGVLRQRCEVLIPYSPSSSNYAPAVRLYCVEKFWRTHRTV